MNQYYIQPVNHYTPLHWFREYRQKYNITYNDNKTVSYKELQWYVFDEDASVGPETDNITTANILLMVCTNKRIKKTVW